jgi:hypothetical protein
LFLAHPPANSQNSISVSHILAPVNQLSVADVDFKNSTTPKWLFTISIDAGGATLSALMDVNVQTPYGSAVHFTTKPFPVNRVRAVTNLNLRDCGQSTSNLVCFDRYEVNTPVRRQLEDAALASGRLPAGQYVFSVTVTDVTGSLRPGSTSFPIVVTNPSTVELIVPMDGDATNSFPLFQWQFDGPSSKLSVFEKLPSQQTAEEAAGGIPHFTQTTAANNLQYPSSGARLLEPGKTYVWYVEGLTPVTGGTTSGKRSQIRTFNVLRGGSATLSSILDELERALPQYQPVFDQLRSGGFTNAGSIHLNGRTVSTLDIMNLLHQFRQNPDDVVTVEVE